ncbi:MAG TPA: YciI family protein [Candidatus Eisenbacteria bacterium]|nr:YciI family protein [Candidatus Eisenbacteria bacterium]
MNFMIMYVCDEMAMARMSPAELDRIVAEKTKVHQELVGLGKDIMGVRLWPSATATRVSLERGAIATVDGPFTETREVLGGFNLVRCASKAEAIEWAKKSLVFESAVTEVRPVWERCLCHGSFTCSSQV